MEALITFVPILKTESGENRLILLTRAVNGMRNLAGCLFVQQ